MFIFLFFRVLALVVTCVCSKKISGLGLKVAEVDFLKLKSVSLSLPTISVGNGCDFGLNLTIGNIGIYFFEKRFVTLIIRDVCFKISVIKTGQNVVSSKDPFPSVKQNRSPSDVVFSEGDDDFDFKDDSNKSSFSQIVFRTFYLYFFRILCWFLENFYLCVENVSCTFEASV